MARVKPDYSRLRERQLELYESNKEKGSEVRDDNPPGYTERTYDQLKRVKFPLILDLITDQNGNQRKAWTVREVLSAMHPAVASLARQYGGKRPSYQPSDAESLGEQAVLDALWTDLGLAWCAGHCFERVKSAIIRGAKTNGLITRSERDKAWRDNIRSADEPFGESGGTIGETIHDSVPLPWTQKCGDWVDEHGHIVHYVHYPTSRKIPEGYRFVPTCNNGKVTIEENGQIVEKICDRCGGKGRIVSFEERRSTPTPDSRAQDNERKRLLKEIWGILTEGLTNRQLEIIMYRLGLDTDILIDHDKPVYISIVAVIDTPSLRCLVRVHNSIDKHDAVLVITTAGIGDKQRIEKRIILPTPGNDADYYFDLDKQYPIVVAELLADPAGEPDRRVWLQREGVPRTPVEVATIMFAKYGMTSKNRVQQVFNAVMSKFKQRQATNPHLTDLIDRFLDEPGSE